MLSPRLAIISLITIALGASTTSACAMPQNLASASTPSTSSAFSAEVVGASDSRGRVHAFWTERASAPGELGETLLWYSIYDTKAEGAPMTRVLDRATSIYSVALAIDGNDEVHAVWVSEADSLGTVPGMRQVINDQRRVNVVNYLRVEATGAVPSRRKLLSGSPGESIWVSVASADDSGSYLAWTEVRRASPTRGESSTYYAPIQRVDIRSLVAQTKNPSKMLRATVSDEHNGLYLAWIEELGDERSVISCSRVDLSSRVTKTVRVEEVEGNVDGLALAPVQGDRVLMAWTYESGLQPRSVLGMIELAHDETTLATDADITLPRNANGVESMTIDPRGNLHVVWAEVAEDLQLGPVPARVGQSILHYAVLSDRGLLEEERRPFDQPLTAAFVVDGDIYVVSGGAVMPSARPALAGNLHIFLLAVALCICFVGVMATESGSYVLARWRSVRPAKGLGARDLSEASDTRLVRRIRAHPGVSLSELRSVTSLGTLDLASRLRLLEDSGTIRSLRQGARRRFYSFDSGLRKSGTNEVRSSIIRAVGQEPGITEADIARRIGVSQQLANYHLRLLGKRMVLLPKREEARVRYFLNERALSERRRVTSLT